MKRSIKLNPEVDIEIEKAKYYFLLKNIKLSKGDIVRLAMTAFNSRLKKEII
ncbi:hypothetical protein C8N40_110119 [Pontibacter mucosus]|uniref:Uncharacterized protein n=1 Tax=Pontibacter mucosus TaxID=1649266 RepID=A0A2T5YDT3_9BACT|nr:hypothetical protein C8N40_110119 [Pontibacter mucosus]